MQVGILNLSNAFKKNPSNGFEFNTVMNYCPISFRNSSFFLRETSA
jgi:hypothetical protein